MTEYDFTDISNIHDTYFKALFQNITNVRDFLEIFFPEIARHLEIESIELSPTEKYSQLLGNKQYLDFAINCKVKKRPIQVYFLFEHKSKVDRGIFLQLMRYMLCVWEEDFKMRKELTPIIPIVFYHGRKKWNVSLSLSEYYKDLPVELIDYLMDFKYLIFDTNHIEDKEIKQLISRNRILLLALDVFRDIYKGADKTHVLKVFEDLVEIIEAHKDEFREDIVFWAQMTIMYVQGVMKIEPEEIHEMLKKKQRTKKVIRPVFEIWREEGFLMEAQESVLDVLQERFGEVPQEIEVKIKSIEKREILKSLLRLAVRTKTLDEFKACLEH